MSLTIKTTVIIWLILLSSSSRRLNTILINCLLWRTKLPIFSYFLLPLHSYILSHIALFTKFSLSNANEQCLSNLSWSKIFIPNEPFPVPATFSDALVQVFSSTVIEKTYWEQLFGNIRRVVLRCECFVTISINPATYVVLASSYTLIYGHLWFPFWIGSLTVWGRLLSGEMLAMVIWGLCTWESTPGKLRESSGGNRLFGMTVEECEAWFLNKDNRKMVGLLSRGILLVVFKVGVMRRLVAADRRMIRLFC